MIQSPAGYQGDVRVKRYLDFYQAGYGVAMLSSGVAFSPLSLFANGEQGGWYDPSDLTTLFQDAAGTTPVTAVEQPVGRVLDKSGRGNHLSQSTSTARPVLSARVNLLTYTEQFDNAAWNNTTATAAVTTDTTDPLGGNTANKITAAGTYTYAAIRAQSVTTAAADYIFSCYAKVGTAGWTRILIGNGGANAVAQSFNLSTGQAGSIQTFGTGYTYVSSSITAVWNGWYRIAIAATTPSGTSIPQIGVANADNGASVTSGQYNYYWGADLRPANAGVGLPAYQRVGAATSGSSTAAGNADYDTTGFPLYLKFDGTDDSLASASIDFTSTDKMSVFAGVRKLAESFGIITELSASQVSNNGAFHMYTDSAQYLSFSSKGTADVYTFKDGYAAPVSAVMSGLSNIAAPVATLRINGAQQSQTTASQGTGQFGNYPIYVGRRGGLTNPFNGHLYSLIIRGAATDAATITATETWVNGKTLAY